MNLADQSYIDQDLTGNVDLLRTGLQKGKRGSGGTALYDSLIKADDHLSQSGQRSKQVVVVITDGKDNASMAALDEAIRRVQATNGPIVYTIGLLYDAGGGDARAAKNALKSLQTRLAACPFSLIADRCRQGRSRSGTRHPQPVSPVVPPSCYGCQSRRVPAHSGQCIKCRRRQTDRAYPQRLSAQISQSKTVCSYRG